MPRYALRRSRAARLTDFTFECLDIIRRCSTRRGLAREAGLECRWFAAGDFNPGSPRVILRIIANQACTTCWNSNPCSMRCARAETGRRVRRVRHDRPQRPPRCRRPQRSCASSGRSCRGLSLQPALHARKTSSSRDCSSKLRRCAAQDTYRCCWNVSASKSSSASAISSIRSSTAASPPLRRQHASTVFHRSRPRSDEAEMLAARSHRRKCLRAAHHAHDDATSRRTGAGTLREASIARTRAGTTATDSDAGRHAAVTLHPAHT